MHKNLLDFLQPAVRSRLADRPATEWLSVPIAQVEGLPAETRRLLHDRHVGTLGDLRKLDLTDARFKLSPAFIEIILCLLFYPQHDPGPDCAWERLFHSAPLAYYAGLAGNPFHTHFGPVFYRGRLDGSARVLVVGQDPATDETLAGRAFVGQAGQLAQNFLAKLGITRSYLMFNTFLFGVQSGEITDALAADATIQGYRNQLFDRAKATNALSLVLAFGSWAHKSVQNWPGLGGIPYVHVTHPTAPSGVAANWNSNLAAAISHVAPDFDGHPDATPYPASAPIPSTDIPRRDLPFGLPSWHGAGGGTRSERVSTAFETQITWTAP
jgi:uracil-DNA glycosylase